MGDTLGLVGGAGALPALMAREARCQGWRIVAFALGEPFDLGGLADRIVACRVGEVGPIFAALAEEGVHHVVLAGRIRKDGLFQGESLDATARALVGRSRDWTDDGLLQTAADALQGMGIEVLDQRRFLSPWLAAAGHLAGPPLAEAVRSDVSRGLGVARDLARHGIGQTVVIRTGTVVAVEGLEGTDEAIRRGVALAGPGAVVVKATGLAHDYRFDTPAVGTATLARCAEGRAAALAVEAGRVLVLDREAIAAEAERARISVVGVSADPRRD